MTGNWTDSEIMELLSIWTEEQITNPIKETLRNSVIYNQIMAMPSRISFASHPALFFLHIVRYMLVFGKAAFGPLLPPTGF